MTPPINSRIRCFASIVRSPDYVRNAFQSHRVLRLWWQLVLILHGKPLSNQMSATEENACVACGFRFYGVLYRIVAAILAAIAAGSAFVSEMEVYWPMLMGAGAIYLWVTADLALHGARIFCVNAAEGRRLLVAFLFFVAVFLGAFVSVVSTIAHAKMLFADSSNMLISLLLLAVGIGSYGLELFFLLGPPVERN